MGRIERYANQVSSGRELHPIFRSYGPACSFTLALCVLPVGFEPTPHWLRARDATITPKKQSATYRIRTCALWGFSPVLFRLS